MIKIRSFIYSRSLLWLLFVKINCVKKIQKESRSKVAVTLDESKRSCDSEWSPAIDSKELIQTVMSKTQVIRLNSGQILTLEIKNFSTKDFSPNSTMSGSVLLKGHLKIFRFSKSNLLCLFSDQIKKVSFLRINNACLLGLTLNWIHHNTDMILKI